MQITRELIQDILPLYLAEEVSMETRALIEDYLETDIQLAKMVEQSKLMEETILPEPIEMDDEMRAFRKAQRKMYQEFKFTQYYVAFGFGVFFTLLWLIMLFFSVSRMGFATFSLAVICWITMVNINAQIDKMGLN